jgi:hypothetical protein
MATLILVLGKELSPRIISAGKSFARKSSETFPSRISVPALAIEK